MRKLLITYLSLQLAQSIGIDHHAAKEELYYYMRTKDNETHTMLKPNSWIICTKKYVKMRNQVQIMQYNYCVDDVAAIHFKRKSRTPASEDI